MSEQLRTEDDPILDILKPKDQEVGEKEDTYVLKFGGKSMDDIHDVVRAVAHLKEQNPAAKVAIACSAFSGVTSNVLNELERIEACFENGTFLNVEQKNIKGEKERSLRAFFERNMLQLRAIFGEAKESIPGEIASVINVEGQEVVQMLNSLWEQWDSGVFTKLKTKILGLSEKISAITLNHFLQQEHPDFEATFEDTTDYLNGAESAREVEIAMGFVAREVKKVLDKGKLPIISGYVGEGTMERIGRGYTDRIAADLTVFLEAILHINKEFALHTADPGLFNGGEARTKKIDFLTVAELEQLVYLQLKALNATAFEALLPALAEGCKVVFKETKKPEEQGTEIVQTRDRESDISVAQGIAMQPEMAAYIVELPDGEGQLAQVFNYCAGAPWHLNIRTVSTSSSSAAITFDVNRFKELESAMMPDPAATFLEGLQELEAVRNAEQINGDLTEIGIIGEQTKMTEGVRVAIAMILMQLKIEPEIFAESKKEPSQTLVVDADKAEDLLRALHLHLVERTKEEFAAQRERLREAFI